jgi:hypothetical protein
MSVPLHLMPQPPQLFSSVSELVQFPRQQVAPSALPQLLPQDPQLFTSEVRLEHTGAMVPLNPVAGHELGPIEGHLHGREQKEATARLARAAVPVNKESSTLTQRGPPAIPGCAPWGNGGGSLRAGGNTETVLNACWSRKPYPTHPGYVPLP